MWLLLEDHTEHLQMAIEACAKVGVTCVGMARVEPGMSIDWACVDLLLVGPGWKKETVQALREAGCTAPTVLIEQDPDEAVRARAFEMGCVDIVSYPLSVAYLQAWARERPVDLLGEPGHTPTLSAMEALLQTKSARTVHRVHEDLLSSTGWAGSPAAALRGRIALIYGLRGGMGKSTVATLLAQEIGSRSYSVALVELDPKGNLQERLRLSSPITVDDWAKMPSAMDERMVRQALIQPRSSLFSLLPRGEHTREVDSATVRRLLMELATYYDLVLIDASPDDELPCTHMAREVAHRVLYVMTPAWDSFRSGLDGYERLRIQKGQEAVTVVVNRSRPIGEHQKAWRLMQEAQIRHLIRLPEDRTLQAKTQQGQTLTGGRALRRALAPLAQELMPMGSFTTSQKGGKRR